MTHSIRRIALLSALAPALALAQGSATPPSAEGKAPADPMAGWTPRKVTPAQEKQAGQQIQQLFKKFEQAGMKGDLDAAVALLDFPVLMVTDNKAGDAVGAPYTEEQWRKEMGPMYQSSPKDMKMTHSPKVFLVSEALASVDDSWTMTMGKKKLSGRSNMLLIRKAGEWKVKSMVEGGWGDMAGPGSAPGSGEKPAEPATGK
jgi:hypothetical protein